jgi:NHLM bacteriocin system ABC transporter ATP-binding protein
MSLLRFSLRGVGREVAGIAALGLLGAVMAALFPLAIGFLFEAAVPRAEGREVLAVILGLTAAALGAGVFDLTQAIALLRIEGRLETAMQPALMHRLLGLTVNFFRGFTSGELTNRVLSIQGMRRILAGTSLQSMLAAVLAASNLVVILIVSPLLGLVSSASVGIAGATAAALAIGELRQERSRVALRGEEDGLVLQVIQAIAKIRVAAAETRIFSVWAQIFARQKRHFRTGQRFGLAGEIFAEVFPLFAMVALLFVASGLLGRIGDAAPKLDLGGFLIVNAAFGQLVAATMVMSRNLAVTLELVPLFERLRPIVTAIPESIADKNEVAPLSGGIEASHLMFRYVEGSRPVLDDVSFRIEPGAFVAFVGPSGSGKSTLLRLLLGFETPASGDILYDGQSISTLDTGSLRRQIGVVLQHGRVTTGSIFENITGGLPYTLADAWAAAQLAGIDHEIEAMPMGMYTLLIEGSSTLSGGQRQRLMIARALIGRPRLLFFDEATSSLDNRSQSLVTRSLEGLRTTRIVIAHRLSTVQRADQILVLDGGRLIEAGNFESLLARDGTFARLARRQII